MGDSSDEVSQVRDGEVLDLIGALVQAKFEGCYHSRSILGIFSGPLCTFCTDVAAIALHKDK